MMREVLQALAWEWVNIAVEYAVVAWVRLPRFGLAVAGVTRLTHPMLMCVLSRFGRDPLFILACEGCVVLVEWGILTLFYGWRRAGFLGWVALLMNGVSYGTGLLLDG